MNGSQPAPPRDIVFISKGTPEDDDFVLWLAPRLEAHGYKTFADILALEPGDRWRREITNTVQTRAIKMLLCCRDATLAKAGVQEEIGIAEDLAKELKDKRFIVPLRLEKFKKVFGIGELQYINFEKRWADALEESIKQLEAWKIPRDSSQISINPNWELYRKRNALKIENAPEPLTSNWLRVANVPDLIRYYQPTGAINHQALLKQSQAAPSSAEAYLRGVFSFCELEEFNREFEEVGRFALAAEIPLMEFLENGAETPSIRGREASNIVYSMFRRAWQAYCRKKNLYEYMWSKTPGFHATESQIGVGKKVKWGTQGENRSSMLRNVAKGKLWQFGVSAIPAFWPFPHFRLKSRVLFSDMRGESPGAVIDDKDVQHRSRRTMCTGWRNKQWHGRLRAFLELLVDDESVIKLPLATNAFIVLAPLPMFFTSPVTTALPDTLKDEDEELDELTLTRVATDEED